MKADDDAARLVPIARRYLAVRRAFYWSMVVMPASVLVALALPVNAAVFLALLACFLAAAGVFAFAGMYLSDFVCPQCGLACTFRRHGRGFPLRSCQNCGLSLRDVLASAD